MILTAIVSGCATAKVDKPVQISTAPIEKPELVLPSADPVSLRPVEWIVVTDQNFSQVFDKLKADGKPASLFALTDSGYTNLSMNTNDLRTYVTQQGSIITAYKNYYIRSQSAMSNAVTVK